MRVHRVIVAAVLVAPHLIEQLLAAVDAARDGGRNAPADRTRARSARLRLPRTVNGMALDVDGHVARLQHAWPARASSFLPSISTRRNSAFTRAVSSITLNGLVR